MEKLMKLADKIKDEDLKEKTKKILTSPEISNKEFKEYPSTEFKECPAGPVEFHHGYEGGLLDHTLSVTKSCIKVAEVLKEIYDYQINMDHLIAAALLHDYMKLFIYSIENDQINRAEALLDHGVWAACELYKRDFPEQVIHIVATHFGAEPLIPQTKEALILSLVDDLDAKIDILDTQQKINAVKKEL